MFARAALSGRNIVKARPLTRKMGDVSHYTPTTMADLPVPQGSWAEAHAKRQRKYNLQLLIGVVFTGTTYVAAANSGLIEMGWGPKIGK